MSPSSRAVMDERSRNLEIVEMFFKCLEQGDLANIPLGRGASFYGPITGGGDYDDLVAFLAAFMPAIKSISVVQHIAEGPFVATEFVADSSFGDIRILGKFQLQGDQIIELSIFYDPRPILGGS
jgi:hypothetical protein